MKRRSGGTRLPPRPRFPLSPPPTCPVAWLKRASLLGHQGLAREEEKAGREDLKLAAIDQVHSGSIEDGRDLGCATWRDAHGLEHRHEGVRHPATGARHAEAGQRHLASQRVVPGDLRRAAGQAREGEAHQRQFNYLKLEVQEC